MSNMIDEGKSTRHTYDCISLIRDDLECDCGWEDLKASIKDLAPDLEKVMAAVARLQARENILVDAMAEVKATNDGDSDQPISAIIQGCIDELNALEES